MQDISERKRHQEELERQANHDMLTGLPNRILLGDRVEQGIARAARLGYYLTVVFIDLDNFKFINDSLGHGAGDELLSRWRDRLRHCVRTSDTVARLGGDEFVLILLRRAGRRCLAAGRCDRVGRDVAAPSCSRARAPGRRQPGRHRVPGRRRGLPTLLRNADTAMYPAKHHGATSSSSSRRRSTW